MTDARELIPDWLNAVACGPAEAFPAMAAEELVIRLPFAPPGVAKTLEGRDQAIAALSPVWTAKERFDWRDVVIRRTEDPELFAVTARSEVRLRSGRDYANDYVIFVRVRDGRVVEHVEYFNPLPVLEAYGL